MSNQTTHPIDLPTTKPAPPRARISTGAPPCEICGARGKLRKSHHPVYGTFEACPECRENLDKELEKRNGGSDRR